jgi:ABC-type phosphate transport system permease subunit
MSIWSILAIIFAIPISIGVALVITYVLAIWCTLKVVTKFDKKLNEHLY